MTISFGECATKMGADLFRDVAKIIEQNRSAQCPYYILINFKKKDVVYQEYPDHWVVSQTIHCLPFRPPAFLGSIIVSVDNKSGKVEWEVNPHDVPDFVPDAPIAQKIDTNNKIRLSTRSAGLYHKGAL